MTKKVQLTGKSKSQSDVNSAWLSMVLGAICQASAVDAGMTRVNAVHACTHRRLVCKAGNARGKVPFGVNVGAYWAGQKTLANATSTRCGGDTIVRWTLPAKVPTGKHVRVTVTGGTLKLGGRVLPWNEAGYYDASAGHAGFVATVKSESGCRRCPARHGARFAA